MLIPTEPIGSIPRPLSLITAIAAMGEPDRARALKIIRKHLKDHRRIFIGVVNPIDQRMESPEEIRDRILKAAEYIPIARLDSTDDCGFSPFSDDTTTARETAFAGIKARVEGTRPAADMIEGW